MSLNFLISSLYTIGKLELALVSVGLQASCATKVLNIYIYLKASFIRFCAVVVFLYQWLLVCLLYGSQIQDITVCKTHDD